VVCLGKQKKKRRKAPEKREEKFYCKVCGREIDEDAYESFDGACWECWDDQMTEESIMMFGDLM
jgi:predicted amidophosphoribosyltransferase